MQPTPDSPNPLPKWLKLRVAAGELVTARRNRVDDFNLPFNKAVKLNVSPNELAAMEYVRANTTIPVPKSKLYLSHSPSLHHP
jgi:hypothetical protein